LTPTAAAAHRPFRRSRGAYGHRRISTDPAAARRRRHSAAGV